MVYEAIKDRIAEGGVAYDIVPVLEGELAGDEGGSASVAVLEDFQQISSFDLIERLEPEVVDLCGASHKLTHVQYLVMWSSIQDLV